MRQAPSTAGVARVPANQTARQYSPMEVLASPVFWVLYLMFVCVAAGGLFFLSSIASVAKDYKIDQVTVGLYGFALPTLTFAISLDRILDGVGRPSFGWLSDHYGRENTMCLAFLIGAGALFTLGRFGSEPVVFVLVSALYFFVFGEIYSVFPATQGDTFGSKFAASNAGMLYTAKGTAALVVPFASFIAASRGWGTVFTIAMTLNIIAGLTAVLVLKPMRLKHFASAREFVDPGQRYPMAEDVQ